MKPVTNGTRNLLHDDYVDEMAFRVRGDIGTIIVHQVAQSPVCRRFGPLFLLETTVRQGFGGEASPVKAPLSANLVLDFFRGTELDLHNGSCSVTFDSAKNVAVLSRGQKLCHLPPLRTGCFKHVGQHVTQLVRVAKRRQVGRYKITTEADSEN